MDDIKHRCDSCALRRECEHTFGNYWGEKSSGGVGCVNRIAPFDIDSIRAKLSTSEISRLSRPCEIGTYHKYFVSYCDGREFTVAARSEKEAVNIVRYKHFYNAPFSRLGEFQAIMIITNGTAEVRKPSKTDILKRISRMKGF